MSMSWIRNVSTLLTFCVRILRLRYDFQSLFGRVTYAGRRSQVQLWTPPCPNALTLLQGIQSSSADS